MVSICHVSPSTKRYGVEVLTGSWSSEEELGQGKNRTTKVGLDLCFLDLCFFIRGSTNCAPFWLEDKAMWHQRIVAWETRDCVCEKLLVGKSHFIFIVVDFALMPCVILPTRRAVHPQPLGKSTETTLCGLDKIHLKWFCSLCRSHYIPCAPVRWEKETCRAQIPLDEAKSCKAKVVWLLTLFI